MESSAIANARYLMYSSTVQELYLYLYEGLQCTVLYVALYKYSTGYCTWYLCAETPQSRVLSLEQCKVHRKQPVLPPGISLQI